jgi:hypothetical protein
MLGKKTRDSSGNILDKQGQKGPNIKMNRKSNLEYLSADFREVLKWPETQTKRQATMHGCLPSLLGGWDLRVKNYLEQRNWSNVRRGKNYFVGLLEQPMQNKNILYQHDKANEPTKKGPLSFVFFESPFTSVSTVSREPPFSSLSEYDPVTED